MSERHTQKLDMVPPSNGAYSGLESRVSSPHCSTRETDLSDAAKLQRQLGSEKNEQVSLHTLSHISCHDVQSTDLEACDSVKDNDGDNDDIPEGGLEAWCVVLGAWCVSFCTYGWINSIGTFQQYYQTGPLKDYTASQIAWIPSMQIFLMSFLAPFAGRIFDSHGPRYLLLTGSFLHVFGLMMASLSSEYHHFMLSQGVCSAVGVSACFLSAVGSVSGWFKKRRGTVFGLFATGSSFGGVVFPIMLNKLIGSIGYGMAMRCTAFLMLFLLTVANFAIKSRHIHGQQRLSKGLLARPFREKTFLFLLVGLALVPFGLYTPIDFIPTVAREEGMRLSLAENLIAFYNAASLVGRAGSGPIADRFGLFNIFSLTCYTAGVLIMALWIPSGGNDATVAFVLLFGLFSGAYIALLPALVARISPIEEVGYRNGIGQWVGSLGGLLTSPIAGLILQGPAGELGLKVFAAVFMIAGTTAIVAARNSRTGMKVCIAF